VLGLATVGTFCAVALGAGIPAIASGGTTDCSTAPNPIVCENQLPGDPASNWQVDGVGDPTIQGFTTSMGVNVGQTVSFKISTPSTKYHVNILRLGWYQGDGARLVQSAILPSASLPQTQPQCVTTASTGEIDCGNWSVSASWTVPSNAVSGVYLAQLVRDDSQDPGGSSLIPFVVRNDASTSAVLMPTDDATWEAYNDYGGNSLYSCTVACPSGNPNGYKGAYAVSYNRPWDGALQTDGGNSYLWYAEYQMIQFMEREGYNVSYTDDVDLATQAPATLEQHKTILFSGHDEYWSSSERANVTAARDAGVNLAMFTGNEIFWKTRWGDSTAGPTTANRTLITYKETHFNAPVDPDDPPVWTGSWADPRFSPPADGGNPANSLTGQMFAVNNGTSDITVPFQYHADRLWSNTSVANLKTGQSTTLGAGDGDLGYEWDIDADNGFRPAGEADLSSTTVSGLETFTDYGTYTGTGSGSDGLPPACGCLPGGTETHNLTLYRAASGALVFGAGTVQWSWGLDNSNAWDEEGTEPSGNPPDPNMEQFTVNLLAMMGVQPGSLESGLVAASPSTNTNPPVSTITSPAPGATIADGTTTTITGSATAKGGGVVAAVAVSTDGGKTWHPATLTSPDGTSVTWSYSWTAHGYPQTTLESRAVDDSANIETPSDSTSVNITCPCTLWGTHVDPQSITNTFGADDDQDPSALELGVQFTSTIDSQVTGVTFYKAAANTGTHVGSLWTQSGTLLAQGTFSNESTTGWQTLTFSSPVAIQAGQTYVAGYYAPNGHYSATVGWFYPGPAPTPLGGATDSSGPWSALIATGTTMNGLYSYGNSPTFPTSTSSASNYWVSPVMVPDIAPGQVTGVSATSGNGQATVTWNAPSTGGSPTTYTVTPYKNGIAQTATPVTGNPPATSTTISGLTAGASYTFTVQASNSQGNGAVSAASNAVTIGASSAPGAPTGVGATAANAQALVSWTAPTANGGSPITGYQITVIPSGGFSTTVPVNSATATSATVSSLTNGTSYTFKVAAINSIGTGTASAASSAVTPGNTLFDFATPQTADSGDSSAVNLGVKFTPASSGTVTGIRFYKASTNTGTHIGSLYSSTGTLLAQATFTNESASGWQTVMFSQPVQVTTGTTYVAAYLAPLGHYSDTPQGFASAVTNGPLTAPASGSVTPGNGLYTYGSAAAFPSSSFGATNYWVDVLFQPPTSGQATAPGAPTGVSVAVANGQASVSWTAPSSNGGSPITGYQVKVIPSGGTTTTVPVNSGTATSTTITGLSDGTSYTFTVAAINAIGTGVASAASHAVTPDDTLFDFGTPQTIDSGDGSAVNLGVQFTPASSGTVTGIRFYKASTNTGTHIGSLYSSTGTLLAQATFTNESASGWQTVMFSQPVPVTGNTTYVASYLAPQGHYSDTAGGFGSAVINGPLIAPASSTVTGGNGVYVYGSAAAFPTNTYGAGNYWVDALFHPSSQLTAPGAPTGVSVTVANGQAAVSWAAPSSNGGSPISGYQVKVIPSGGTTTTVPVNSGTAATTTITGLSNGTSYTFTVAAINSVGTGSASAPSNAVTPDDTLFDFGTPQKVDSGDGSSVNLGTQFTPSSPGEITGIRFYKASTNTGTHIGSLYSSTGTLLAQATFTNESASGWQTAMFSQPVQVTANTTYVAAYFAPQGHYADNSGGLVTAVTNGPLTAPASGSVAGGNGVYVYGSVVAFPANTYGASNYWVDALFQPSS
jgi:hypothetical protein